ncbi:MAG: PASTA domain-containing protein [Clostridia bacterium]|nr:PASTA domain-containing protein [Clostridia bacterium]
MVNTDRLCPGCMKDNGGETVCSLCGWDSSKSNAPDKLPIRFIIRDRYVIGKTLFSDTESTVYLGFDTAENRAVSIKEFFPAGLAQRNPDNTVFVPREAQFAYNEALIEFIETNKKFIGFPLACLPSTYSVFEENSTAYAVCDAISGITLKSYIERSGGIIRWEQARPLFLPLIDTLKAINDMGLVHGAVSPDTVIVCRDGKLRLLGVSISGIKRVKVHGSGECALTPFLNDGYAAAEQYNGSVGEVGGHTDVYGMCATLLTTITGIVPPEALSRLKADTLKIPSHFADELPRQVLVSIANGMQVKPEMRTKDVDTLKNELIYGETKENIRKAQRASAATTKVEVPTPQKKSGSGIKYAVIASVITAVILLAAGGLAWYFLFRDNGAGNTADTPQSQAPDTTEQVKEGDVDPDVAEQKQLYTVPDFTKKTYLEIVNSNQYKNFTFAIKGKEYNSRIPRGQICEQSVEANSSVEYGTEIEFTVSLGSFETNVPDIIGKTESEAIIMLLKAGFENIDTVTVNINSQAPGVVLDYDFDPALKSGQKINVEMKILIYVNDIEEAAEEN